MLSKNSSTAKTRPGNGHPALNGRDVAFEDIDGVFAASRRRAVVRRPDSSARQIPSIGPEFIGPESAREADCPPLSFWSVVFENLMEGFALYGSSLHANGFAAELPRMDDNIRQAADEMSPPRGPRAVVPYSASREEVAAARLEQTSGVAFTEVALLESKGAASAGVVRRTVRRLWNLTAGFWANWRREREITKAVRALAEFDERTLRDMGIGDRAQIDRTVRYGRDF